MDEKQRRRTQRRVPPGKVGRIDVRAKRRGEAAELGSRRRQDVLGERRRGTHAWEQERAAYAAWRRRLDSGRLVCSQVPTMAQKGETCWFMGIFTTLFFSQHTRAVIIPRVWALPDRSALKVTMMNILEIYDRSRVQDLMSAGLKDLKPHHFIRTIRLEEPETFGYDPELLKKNEHGATGFWPAYQHAFLGYLGVPHLAVHRDAADGRFKFSAFNFDLNPWGPLVDQLRSRSPIGKSVDVYLPDVLIVHPTGYDSTQSAMAQAQVAAPAVGAIVVPPGETPVPTRVSYNGHAYVLDAVIMASTTKNACSILHAIAGVTCNGERYVFNGWVSGSGDRAMAGAMTGAGGRSVPCPLMKRDWATASEFCLDAQGCRLPDSQPANLAGRNFCFSGRRGSVVYVRVGAIRDASAV